MGSNIRGNGKMANRMELAFISIQKGNAERDSGKVAKESSGLNENPLFLNLFCLVFFSLLLFYNVIIFNNY